jgi:hypothetical protein
MKFDLFELCQNGPQTKLDQIIYSYMAIFVSSLAAFEKMKTEQSDLMERLTSDFQSEINLKYLILKMLLVLVWANFVHL